MFEILKRHRVKGTNCNYADVIMYGVMNTIIPSWESDRCSLISMQKKIYYECDSSVVHHRLMHGTVGERDSKGHKLE
eukprot:scaffold14923_cov149-Skeletonema_dohrnii-CCMP3373.AAC.1